MMFGRNPFTAFDLDDNQSNGNPVLSSLSGEYMNINDPVAKIKCIYQFMIAKAHTQGYVVTCYIAEILHHVNI